MTETELQDQDYALRVKALEDILVKRGLVTSELIDQIVHAYENDIGPMNGAKVVARAWTDDAYRQRLLQNGTAAIAEFGLGGPQGDDLIVVANQANVHNVIVCTLCSCYPWPVLGLPPKWYKDPAYRAQIVRDPRRTLLDAFGLDVPADTQIRVWDSTAEQRYMVLPEQPARTKGMSETELAALVTRDAMIGVSILR